MQQFTRALVTGASTGIGAAIARELARRGTDLVLVARSADRLEELATELRGSHRVDAEVLRADLLDEEDLAVTEARVSVVNDAPVDLLVNNAGFGSASPFVDQSADRAEAEIRLNTIALTRLTHAILPHLLAEGRGGILNVSSVGAYQPVPRMAVYAATKAYVSSFTQALHEEVHGSGVHVTVLCPGFTRTDFPEAAGAESEASRIPGFAWQEPEPVATAGVDGVARGRAVVVSGVLNQVTTAVSSLTPSGISRRVVGRTIGILSP